MNSVATIDKNFVGTVSSFLNKPEVKQGVKDYAGLATIVFGGMQEIHFLNSSASSKTWTEATGRFSLILCAAATPLSYRICSRFVDKAVSQQFLVNTFGPNTIFAVNPWHPRHVISFVAVACTLPTVIVAIYDAALGVIGKVFKSKKEEDLSKNTDWTEDQLKERPKPTNHEFLTSTKVKWMVLFNFVTSRPVLHLGNQLARKILNRA